MCNVLKFIAYCYRTFLSINERDFELLFHNLNGTNLHDCDKWKISKKIPCGLYIKRTASYSEVENYKESVNVGVNLKRCDSPKDEYFLSRNVQSRLAAKQPERALDLDRAISIALLRESAGGTCQRMGEAEEEEGNEKKTERRAAPKRKEKKSGGAVREIRRRGMRDREKERERISEKRAYM